MKRSNNMFSFITNLFKPKPKKPSKAGLTMMTKKELEKLGRKYGIAVSYTHLRAHETS